MFRERRLSDASDETVFAVARQEDRILVSADTDFGTLLAQSEERKPSLVLFRGRVPRAPLAQARLQELNLPELAADLEAGCVAVIEEDPIRLRRLPITG